MYRLLAFFALSRRRETSVNEILRHRIGERIGALKISWRKASLDSGLGPGFIQDVITGRLNAPSEQALESLAVALKCSPAFLLGHTDEVAGETGGDHRGSCSNQEDNQRPDAVMALRIVEELLAAGHVDAARIAVRRALKAIALD